MDRKRVFEILVVGLYISIAVALYIRSDKKNITLQVPIVSSEDFTKSGKNYKVKKVTVLKGDTFDLTLLPEGNRIIGKLALVATSDAKSKVLDLLNSGERPRVVLKNRNSEGYWEIDFFFFLNSKEINLSEWIVSNNLVYQ